MRLPPLPTLAIVAVLALALFGAVACGGDDAAPSTPTPTTTSVVTATPTATVATGNLASVHAIDWGDVALIGPIIDHFGGGEIDPQRIQYTDFTRDGQDEAFVFVESGGTAGDVGAALVGVSGGAATVLGHVESGGRIEIRFPEVGGGIVVTTEGVWERDDAECCPSRLRERTYEWAGDEFLLRDEQVVDNPDAGSRP